MKAKSQLYHVSIVGTTEVAHSARLVEAKQLELRSDW